MRNLDRRSYGGILRPHFCAVFLSSLTLIILFIIAGDARAALIPWQTNASGTGDGFYWQGGGSDHGLFDNPILLGDGHTLEFSWKDDFMAQSLNGKPVTKSDRLQIDIIAAPGECIDSIEIDEGGTYGISTVGKVSASAAIFITNLDQYSVISSIVPMKPSMPISTAGSGSWSGQASIDTIGWTDIRIVLNNNLIAASPLGSNSFIKKTSFDLIINTYNNIMPEPATIIILSIGISALPLLYKKQAIGRRSNNKDEFKNLLNIGR